MNENSYEDALYIIDSYGLIYRAYYAFISNPMINSSGQNVSAIFGFFRNLKAVLDHYKPKYLAAAFDSKVPTFRHEMYQEYKATRQKTPEDLHQQIPLIEEILTTLGIPILRCDGFEADDVIATMADKCCAAGKNFRILSADKDLMQLVGCSTQILKPNKAGGWEVVNSQGVLAEWGVLPEGMLDLLSLIGDSADNIPGVAGVGIKTALKLLSEYGSLEEIYAHAEEISGAVGNKVRAGKENAFFSKQLISLRKDVPLELDPTAFSTDNLDFEKASQLLIKLGIPSVAKQFAEMSTKNSVEKPISNGTENNSIQNSVTEKVQSEHFFPEQEYETLTKNSGDYRVVTELSDLITIVDRILSANPVEVAFDCETDGLDCRKANLVGFSLSRNKGTGAYVPLVFPDALLSGAAISKEAAITQLERLFLCPDCKIIMHNGKFDYQVLRSNGMGKPTCQIFDTMVAAWLIEPERSSYSLESLAQGKLGLETIPYNQIVPKNGTFADVPLAQAVLYAAEDADLTWQLYQLFLPRLKQTGLEKLFWELEMPILPILAEMELRGIRIEKQELNVFGKELSSEIQRIKSEIYEIVGHEFNIASTKQLQQVLFEERGLEPGKKTKSGYSTDIAVLETLAAYDPVPRKILEYRVKSKLLSTYVETLPQLADENQRVHTSFIQTGTATGRLSSRDPNLQNIPVREEEGRRIRMAFTAEPGNLLISADYSQIELVILAHLSKDSGLCGAFESGVDVHKATAALIFGVDSESVTPEMRRTAKTINFGVMYGMSAFRLANELGISRSQAQDFIKTYFSTYSGVRSFMDEVISKAEETGYVETLFHRRRFIRSINSRNKMEKSGAERMAVNTPIQGSAADIVKQAMLNVTSALEKEKLPAKLLLQVHDELIFECPEAQVENAAKCIKETMENVLQLKVPLKVSVETGFRWGEFH